MDFKNGVPELVGCCSMIEKVYVHNLRCKGRFNVRKRPPDCRTVLTNYFCRHGSLLLICGALQSLDDE